MDDVLNIVGSLAWNSQYCITDSNTENYVFSTLRINEEKFKDINKDLLFRNYVHLICNVVKDIRDIESRISEYSSKIKKLQNENNNQSEYEKRKLNYFLEMNKTAKEQICRFLSENFDEYVYNLSHDSIDLIESEYTKKGPGAHRFRRRYNYGFFKEFYSYDFPYGICVKLSQFLKDKFPHSSRIIEEKDYIQLYKKDPISFWNELIKYVDQYHIMSKISTQISTNYHMSKRSEVFETLNELFQKEKYQSFISLALIQIEGLFTDFCNIKYGEKEHQGTLLEKAKKTLESEEYLYMKMYPYFAYDISIMRNEVAHTGILKTEELKQIAYELVLDLNSLSYMVKSESFMKYIEAAWIFEKIMDYQRKGDPEPQDFFYDSVAHKFISISQNSHLWKLIKNPADYQEELSFYKIPDDLRDNYYDIPSMIYSISKLIRTDEFWKALHRFVADYVREDSCMEEVVILARIMKNDYIGELTGIAKSECIEIKHILEKYACGY